MLHDKLFENIFASTRITDIRLVAFTGELMNRIARLDTEGKYKGLAARLAGACEALHDEITGLDRNVNTRMGKTGQVVGTTEYFRQQMSELEGVIAHALGGFSSEGYLAFYPHGRTEYRIARLAMVPTLLDRVHNAAAAYADKLGPDLQARLQAFRPAWHAARDDQEQAKGAVSGSRAQRSEARRALEQALLVLVHTIAGDHPGNVAACKAWFDFTLLEAAPHPARRRRKDNADEPVPGSNG